MSANKSITNRFKPETLDDIIGQEHLLGPQGIIRRMVDNQKPYSLLLYGPPGIGKSTIAICLCKALNVTHGIFNASIDNKETLKQLLEEANNHSEYIIIVEEIHRLNRDKQDILLPLIESHNTFIFATTTENPYFVINPALRSRCQILQLETINQPTMLAGLQKITSKLTLQIEKPALEQIANIVNGDLRVALNIIDVLVNLYHDVKVDLELIKQIFHQPILLGAHYGDQIHDLKSALHKSLRGSDIDASLYYLAQLINIGALDDIVRRLLAVAYEDIGLAAPAIVNHVAVGIESVYRLGLPEAINILGVLCIEIATAPKSNAASQAIHQAITEIENGLSLPIPMHIRDQSYASSKKLGIGGYKYPHDYENSYVTQTYLPQKLKDKKYYQPKLTSIHEQKLLEWINKLKNLD